MQIKFKKLVPEAVPPMQGTNGAAGWDFTATEMTYRPDLRLYEYHTGIAVEIPSGYVGLVFPRSSVYKQGLILSNCVGVIDSDYRGEVMAKFYICSTGMDGYREGDRIFQMVVVPIPKVEFVEVEELSKTERGTGGYGSTGR